VLILLNIHGDRKYELSNFGRIVAGEEEPVDPTSQLAPVIFLTRLHSTTSF
jgi:hypothetical protein